MVIFYCTNIFFSFWEAVVEAFVEAFVRRHQFFPPRQKNGEQYSPPPKNPTLPPLRAWLLQERSVLQFRPRPQRPEPEDDRADRLRHRAPEQQQPEAAHPIIQRHIKRAVGTCQTPGFARFHVHPRMQPCLLPKPGSSTCRGKHHPCGRRSGHCTSTSRYPADRARGYPRRKSSDVWPSWCGSDGNIEANCSTSTARTASTGPGTSSAGTS